MTNLNDEAAEDGLVWADVAPNGDLIGGTPWADAAETESEADESK